MQSQTVPTEADVALAGKLARIAVGLCASRATCAMRQPSIGDPTE